MDIDSILGLLLINSRPRTRGEFDKNLNAAKEKGYKVPELDYERMVTDQVKAGAVLAALGVSGESLFYQVYQQVNFLPKGCGGEINTLDQILRCHSDSFWEDEYPGFSKKYLELSSIEGEGSFFYETLTDSVYDVCWNDMDDFVVGSVEARWKKFSDFLEWRYSGLGLGGAEKKAE